ncbi:LemA family protein [bacterium]|nr:LemA family protein [bacterium]
MNKILLILGGVLVLAVLYLVGMYNSLVTLEQDVANKQSQVEVVLQRRFDLIPNLVNSTKGVLAQEQKVFSDIANARTKYGNASAGSNDKVNAANELESALSRLLVVVENYPQLKSDQTVKDLMTELAGSENRIAVERQRYNDSVTIFNTRVKLFPTNILAGMLGFEAKPLFEATQGADSAPVVDLEN